MLLALADLVAYFSRRGRHARHARQSAMGCSFIGGLPTNAEALLRPGDALLVSEYDSVLAWGVMYLTSSEVSHVAMVLDGRKIIHATLAGVVVEPIETLYSPQVRILPIVVSATPEERQATIERSLSRLGWGYSWGAVCKKGLAILFGREKPYFRWRFAVDVLIALALAHLLVEMGHGEHVLIWIAAAYLSAVFANLLRWRWDPLRFDEAYGKPHDVLVALRRMGARFVWDGDAFQRREARKAGRAHDVE